MLIPGEEPNKFVAEASQLQLPPGHWPQTLNLDGVSFLRFKPVRENGELVAVLYHSETEPTIELTVFND